MIDLLNRRDFMAAAVAVSAVAAGCSTPSRGQRLPNSTNVSEPAHYASLLDTAASIRTGRVSPVELTTAMLERAARLQPSLHAHVTITDELAVEQAIHAERDIARGEYRGPLHGIPVAVKDSCCTKDIVTTAGMAIHSQYRPDHDATVVSRLRDAGAVLLGKLTLTEGASGDYHPTVAPALNPWDSRIWAGSSSSGSAVATAAGLCFGSLGSDTTGSIRYPAAANGVTGLKPTWGRVSRYGVFPLAESLDHVGPIARTAADVGALLAVIAGPDPADPTAVLDAVPDYLSGLGPRLDGVRVGVDPVYNDTGADPDTIAMMDGVTRTFEGLGANVVRVRVPDPEELITAGLASCAAEAALAHASAYPAQRGEYGSLATLLDVGRAATAMDAMRAQHARLTFSGELTDLFADLDLLLTPTQPPATLTIERIKTLWSTREGTALMWRFTEPFNMSGNPAIALPGGFTPSGLPMTFQLVAPHLHEQALIRAGHAFQQATDWHHRHPIA